MLHRKLAENLNNFNIKRRFSQEQQTLKKELDFVIQFVLRYTLYGAGFLHRILSSPSYSYSTLSTVYILNPLYSIGLGGLIYSRLTYIQYGYRWAEPDSAHYTWLNVCWVRLYTLYGYRWAGSDWSLCSTVYRCMNTESDSAHYICTVSTGMLSQTHYTIWPLYCMCAETLKVLSVTKRKNAPQPSVPCAESIISKAS